MININKISLRNKLIIIQLFTAIIVIALCISAFVINDISLFKKNKVNNLSATAQIISNNSIAALLFLDKDAAEEMLLNLQVNSDIVNAAILDKNGEPFASYLREEGVGFSFNPPVNNKTTFHRFDGEHLMIYHKIFRHKDFLGTICLRVDLQDLNAMIRQYINIAIVVLLTSILIAFLIAYYMQQTISVPMLRLVKTMKNISEKTDYSVRVNVKGSDELSILSGEFNKMLEQIESREKALSEANISLEKKVEERTRELKARQEQIETIFEQAPDAVIAINQQGKIIHWNPKSEQIFGWSSREVMNKLLTETIIPPKYKQGHTQGLSRFLQTEEGKLLNKTFEITALHKNGNEFQVELTISPTRIKDEYVFISFLRDITERKKIEQALRTSEDKYRQMVEKAGDVVYTTDYKGHFVYLNPRCKELTGFEEADFVGKHFSEVVAPEWKQKVVDFYLKQFTGKTAETIYSFPIITKYGKYKWIEQTVILLRNGDWITGFQCIVRDITERKQMEEELELRSGKLTKINSELEDKTALLEEQNESIRIKNIELERAREEIRKKMEELALANKFKSEFLANVSHELRTPLNSILILAKLLAENKEKKFSEAELEFVNIIYKSGNDLLQLINDILDLSKIEAGKIEIEFSNTYLKDIKGFIKSIYASVAEQKKIDLKITVDKNVPAVLLTDELRLEQILKNLLSNAFKFTPEKGHVTLQVQLNPAWIKYRNHLLNRENVIAFTVTDTGIGIPKSKQEIIFEAFSQADTSTSRKFGGTGLGLSISRDLAHLLGGEIHLWSEEGTGSRFTLCLPMKPALEFLQEAKKITEEPNSNGLSKNILVVDDDFIQQKAIRALIEKNEMQCVSVKNAHEAMEALLKKSFDCVVIDFYLPDSSGIALLENIRKNIPHSNIPAIMFTAKDMNNEDQKRIAELDGTIIVKSGYAFDKLLSEIRKQIDWYESKARKQKSLLAHKTIMLVDDDSRNVFALKSSLQNFAVNVITARNGRECLEKLSAHPETNIILMDMMMPEMDGFEAIREIKKQSQFRKIPIIAVTANAMVGDKEKCLAVGASDYLSKPINTDTMISLIENWTAV